MRSECARGVIFDLDGTLYTMRAVKLRMSLRLLGSLELLRRMSGARRALRGRRFADREAIMGALYRELAMRAGVTEKRAGDWYQGPFMSAFVDLIAVHGRTRPGLSRLLDGLRGRGVRLAVVSDFGRVADRLEALGLDPRVFDELVAAEDHGVLKPLPDPLMALAARWRVPASEIVVVGDRSDLDEDAASAAGMQFVGVSDRLFTGGENYLDWKTASAEIEARTGAGVST